MKGQPFVDVIDDGFGIYADVNFVSEDGPRGRFLFIVQDRLVGLPQDDSALLAASARWARTFLNRRAREPVPNAGEMAPDELYYHFWGGVMGDGRTPRFEDIPPLGKEAGLTACSRAYGLTNVGESSVRDSAVVLAIPTEARTRIVVLVHSEPGEFLSVYVDSDALVLLLERYIEWVGGHCESPEMLEPWH